MEKLKEIMMFLFIFSIYFFTFKEGLNIITNSIAILFVGVVVFDLFANRKKIYFHSFFGLFLTFIFICSISYFYAKSQVYALQTILSLVQIFIFCFATYNYLDSIDKINRALIYIAISGMAMGGYLLFSSGEMTSMRLGRAIGNENMVGLILDISYAASAYFIFAEKKFIYLIPATFLAAMIMLTGSRMALIIMIVVTIFTLFKSYVNSISGIIKIVILIPVVLGIIAYIVMNDPYFYSIIGIRFENLIMFVTGRELVSNEKSLMLRRMFSNLAYMLFSQNPITGVGINNFRVYLNASLGISTYAHNDLAELLADVGLFGAISYYAMYVVSIVKVWGKGITFNFFIVVLGTIGITTTFAGIVYYSKHMYLIMTICAAYSSVYQKPLQDEVSIAKQVQ